MSEKFVALWTTGGIIRVKSHPFNSFRSNFYSQEINAKRGTGVKFEILKQLKMCVLCNETEKCI